MKDLDVSKRKHVARGIFKLENGTTILQYSVKGMGQEYFDSYAISDFTKSVGL